MQSRGPPFLRLRVHEWMVSTARAKAVIDDYLVLCFPLLLAAPVAVILLVCISSPIYLCEREVSD